MWVAACRRYSFIGEFAEQVVRERFLLMVPTLGYEEFDSFVREKSLWHPELLELQESTLKELRKTVFRMLVEADILINNEIIPVTLTDRTRLVLDAKVPSDIRFFPTLESKVQSYDD